MRPNPRLVVGAAILGLLILLSSFSELPAPAHAAINAVIPAETTVVNPNTTSIAVLATETDNGGAIVVQVSAGTLFASASGCSAGGGPCTTFSTSNNNTSTVTITAAHDGPPADEDLTLIFLYTPPTVTSPLDVTISACQAVGPCTPTPRATIRILPEISSIAVTATPNELPCSGGTTTITARATDPTGATVGGMSFHFSTTGGLLTQTSATTATLTLSRGSAPVTVTASVGGQGGNVVVRLNCGPPATSLQGLVLVVTANPNVVVCGGTSEITASVRDANGNPVAGFGYHFYVDSGHLVVGPPPTADATQARATLTIFPGMSAATVWAEAGRLVGGIETVLDSDKVTVQQFCPSHATAPGVITLKASQTRVHCGGSTFIAATVKDVTNNFVPDGTVINFMANVGTVTPASAETKGGVLNVRYTADQNASGVATITAAGGASFGKIEITLDCAGPAPASNGAPPRPLCIGDGICIIPPSTGDSGLRRLSGGPLTP